MTNPTASTVLNKSPQKVRLMINSIRGKRLDESLYILKAMNKGKTKKVHDLLLMAANNSEVPAADYSLYIVSEIVAEEAQTLYRVEPRARGSAFRIRRRQSRIKVKLSKI